jgi:hypothetical protein
VLCMFGEDGHLSFSTVGDYGHLYFVYCMFGEDGYLLYMLGEDGHLSFVFCWFAEDGYLILVCMFLEGWPSWF